MIESQRKAEEIVGQVDWQSDAHGLCRCPGEATHTSHTRVRDTTVFVDSVPTIFCWHTSCTAYRDEANRKLRKAILNDPLYRPVNIMSTGTTSVPMPKPTAESDILKRITTIAESNKSRYLTHYHWDPADMFEESPTKLVDPDQGYKLFLSLFAPDDVIWIGAVKDSGNHPQNFRSQAEWSKLDAPVGQFTTGAVFAPGCISRANENVVKRKYLVIESDTLSKGEMGAVIRLMKDKFNVHLRAIIDTGGKSIHGWFDMPQQPELFEQVKAFLIPLGCDPATFKPSQPVRIPSAPRGDKVQSLLWFCKGGKVKEAPMIEPAIALGIKPKVDEWPPIKSYTDLMQERMDEPEVLIDGILHRGGKLLLGGGSKAYKSWSLIDLALSLHSGTPWWGQDCKPCKVLFINFEIQEWSFRQRLADVIKAKGLEGKVDDFATWTLRGYAADLTLIRPQIEKEIEGKGYQAVVLDPNYMLMGERDENNAGDMASLMNEFEALAVRHHLSIILSHHFSKGNKSGAESIDRFSGSGVFARNPDTLVVLTAHEEDERSYTCEITLRNFPPVDSFVLQWHYPLFTANFSLNPDKLKKANSNRSIDDKKLLIEMGSKDWVANQLVKHLAEKFDVSERTIYKYIERLVKAGKILKENGLYTAHQATF